MVLQVQVLSRLPSVMTTMRKKLKVVEKNLGKHKAWGLYYHGENLIEIDKRMRPRHFLGVLIHELLHHHFPWMSETMVGRVAPKMAKTVWASNFRRVAKAKRACRLRVKRISHTDKKKVQVLPRSPDFLS